MLLITSVIANVVLVGATAAALQRANCKDKDESGLAWDAEVMQLYKSGQFEECPAETTWWTHHANVTGRAQFYVASPLSLIHISEPTRRS